MKQVKEATGKTVEAAILNGAREFGVDRDLVTYEIIDMPKKGFLGFGEAPARVRVFYEAGSECTALDFIRTVIEDMELDAQASVTDIGTNSKLIKIEGNDSGILIGHHGETLDSLQYLAGLVANRREEDEGEDSAAGGDSASKKQKYVKISVDIEDYRAKREETLRTLARRMAAKVAKYGKSVTLEPMNPYERRIIHSEIQNISGVTTTSVGAENNRRVVIYIDNKDKEKNKAAVSAAATASSEPKKDRPNVQPSGQQSGQQSVQQSAQQSAQQRRRRRPKPQRAAGENAAANNAVGTNAGNYAGNYAVSSGEVSETPEKSE